MGIRCLIVIAAVSAPGVIFSTPPAAAQEARSFEQVQVLIKPGDTIHVTDYMGVISKFKVS